MEAILFEQAVYEAFQFTGKDLGSYDLENIFIDDTTVVATDGTCCYIAHVKSVPCVGAFHLACLPGKASKFFPVPRKNKIKYRTVRACKDKEEYFELLGTRFWMLNDDNVPPFEKIRMAATEAQSIPVDDPRAFMSALKAIRAHKKDIKKKHFAATGERVKPECAIAFYVTDNLLAVTGIAIGRNDYVPVANICLTKNVTKVPNNFTAFDERLYKLSEGPTAISWNGVDRPIGFHLPGRMIVIMPVERGLQHIKIIEDFVYKQ